MVIEKAQRETRFIARAARVDSTVVEADIRYPSDAMIALQGARSLTREGRKLQQLTGAGTRVRDRSRSIGKKVRAISKTLARRTGEAKREVMALNEQAGRLIKRSVKEAVRLAAAARHSARGRGAKAKLTAATKLERLAGRRRKVAEQIDRRFRGLKITDRLVSITDPDARPIRKGKLGKPTEFGYVTQICEVTENTRKGARGFILPPGHAPGNPAENTLLPPDRRRTGPGEDPAARPRRRRRVSSRTNQASVPPTSARTGSTSPTSTSPAPGRTRKRRARYRTGIEGRISHLKRGYGLRRSRLKGQDGMRIWTEWAILATTSTRSPSGPAETLRQPFHQGEHSQA